MSWKNHVSISDPGQMAKTFINQNGVFLHHENLPNSPFVTMAQCKSNDKKKTPKKIITHCQFTHQFGGSEDPYENCTAK